MSRWPALVVIAAAFAAFVVLAFLAVEFALRRSDEVELQFYRQQRLLHCLDHQDQIISLCPNQDRRLTHPDGFQFHIRTNDSGEREVYDHGTPPASACGEVWLIGDSIMMGYGVDQADHFAALLAATFPERRVRNLAVDSLGASAIGRRLSGELQRRSAPSAVIWNFHASDYLDDPAEAERLDDNGFRPLFQLAFWLQRQSALLLWLRLQLAPPQENQLALPENEDDSPAPQIEPSHPTLQAVAGVAAEMQRRQIPFFFLIYPEIDRRRGLPAAESALKESAAAVAVAGGAREIDLHLDFQSDDAPSRLYIPVDGHPSAAAQLLFLRGVAGELRQALAPCAKRNSAPQSRPNAAENP